MRWSHLEKNVLSSLSAPPSAPPNLRIPPNSLQNALDRARRGLPHYTYKSNGLTAWAARAAARRRPSSLRGPLISSVMGRSRREGRGSLRERCFAALICWQASPSGRGAGAHTGRKTSPQSSVPRRTVKSCCRGDKRFMAGSSASQASSVRGAAWHARPFPSLVRKPGCRDA